MFPTTFSERLRGKGRHGVIYRLKAVWSMPERFTVVCTMQGAIQVLWFTFTLPLEEAALNWCHVLLQRNVYSHAFVYYTSSSLCQTLSYTVSYGSILFLNSFASEHFSSNLMRPRYAPVLAAVACSTMFVFIVILAVLDVAVYLIIICPIAIAYLVHSSGG